MSEYRNGFLLTVVCLAYLGPLRPGIILGTLVGCLWHHLDLGHGFTAVTDAGTHTVIAGVTATDDHHVFVLCIHILFILKIGIKKALGIGFQEIHRKIDSFCISAGCIDIAGIGGATGKYHPVKFL